jgi:chorismate mutase
MAHPIKHLTDTPAFLLRPFRQKIDALDDKIVALLVERLTIIDEVAQFKKENDIPAILQDRVDDVINRAGDQAKQNSPYEDDIREIYTFLVTLCCAREEKFLTSQKKD